MKYQFNKDFSHLIRKSYGKLILKKGATFTFNGPMVFPLNDEVN